MALHRPEDWKLTGHFPDPREPGSTTKAHWSLTLDEPIQLEGTTYELDGSLEVDVQLRRESHEVVATLDLNGTVLTPCCRCLSKIAVAIQENFMYSYILRQGSYERDVDEAYADSVVDLQVSRLTGPIELGDLVWECFLVSLPRYAGCGGECETPIQWENDTTDLRLAPLAELLNFQKGGNQDGDA